MTAVLADVRSGSFLHSFGLPGFSVVPSIIRQCSVSVSVLFGMLALGGSVVDCIPKTLALGRSSSIPRTENKNRKENQL